ncbi:MAG: PilZ domain-containing protein [Acidobacteriota bacterium]|nr:PilZ domain-containing protein [Acidobacteriota bacterium]
MNPTAPERRRYGRMKLDEPLPAKFGDARARVVELSIVGFRIAHEGRLQVGDRRTLVVDWQGTSIELSCSLVRSTLYRLAKKMGEQSIYQSGLRIVGTSRESYERLRELIGDRILRALEEQKANARGIPPLAAYMYQPEKGDLFRRCEYIDGAWRKSETIRPAQPMNGFTVAAEVAPQHVDLLCETWERTTEEGRRLTQLLAELSVSKVEGVPTRRYVP